MNILNNVSMDILFIRGRDFIFFKLIFTDHINSININNK